MTFYKPENVEIFSTLSTPSTVVIFVCAIIAVSLLRNKFRSGLRNIPGPTLAAYTALWRWHDVRKGQAHQTAISLHRKYGPLVRIGPNHVSVSDPQEIKKIYGLKSGYTKVRRTPSPMFFTCHILTYLRRGFIPFNLLRGRESPK